MLIWIGQTLLSVCFAFNTETFGDADTSSPLGLRAPSPRLAALQKRRLVAALQRQRMSVLLVFQQINIIYDADYSRIDRGAGFSCRRSRRTPTFLHDQNRVTN